MAYRHIPTMTNSHHGGFLSVMIMLGICQWQNPTIDEDDEELQLFNHLTLFNSFDISEVIVTEVMCGPRAICLFSNNCHLDICNPQKIILIRTTDKDNEARGPWCSHNHPDERPWNSPLLSRQSCSIAMHWCKSFVCKKDEGRFGC